MNKKDYIKFADLFLKLRSNKQWNGWNGQLEHELLNGMCQIFRVTILDLIMIHF